MDIQTILKKELIVVGGPTASGKTDIAINIAKKIGGMLVNADSVQVYKYLDIGSNKGHIEAGKVVEIDKWLINEYEIEKSGIKGILFNIVEPDFNFTVAHYQQLAYKAIAHIRSLGKIPILVGGTGLYIDCIVKGYIFEPEQIDTKLRSELDKLEIYELKDKLIDLSPQVYQNLNESDKNNPRRLIRLIEKILNNKPIKKESKDCIDHIFVYPEFDKQKLMDKIDKRVDWMFDNGFVQEVQQLLDRGYTLENKSMQSTGYKEIVKMLLDNEYNIEQCKNAVKIAHKKYAKRQITWFEGPARQYSLLPFSSFSFLFVTFFMFCSFVFF